MSSYTILTIVIGVVWLTIGLGLSIVMGRRGHLSVGWGVLGTMLGPLAIVAAVATSRHEKEEQPSVIAPPTPLGGPVDVVVGFIKGKPELEGGILSGALTHSLTPDPWMPIVDEEVCDQLADELRRA